MTKTNIEIGICKKKGGVFTLFVLIAGSTALIFGSAGCGKSAADASSQTQPAASDAQDPEVDANLAPSGPSGTQAPGASDAQGQSYADGGGYDNEDSSYGQPAVEASDAPPPLPEYSQPECPGDGYLWTPGYWSYASQGYYWVPGAWARPPEVGLLWTPGYWSSSGGRYRFHYGFWGRYIGFYGGINYGFGYVGAGYQGGYWNGNRFEYNRTVNNITNVNNTYVYNRAVTNTVVINNQTITTSTNSRVSYNGPGGVSRRPLPTEVAAMREQRVPPMTTQLQVQREAAQNREQFASANHGRPAMVAAAKPVAEGKPIAAVIAARPTPSATNEQPRRAEPSRVSGAVKPSEGPAPTEKPVAPARKTAEPRPPAAKPAAEPSAQPQPAKPIPPKTAPAPESKRPNPPPEKQEPSHAAPPQPTPKTPPPTAKKAAPEETPKKEPPKREPPKSPDDKPGSSN